MYVCILLHAACSLLTLAANTCTLIMTLCVCVYVFMCIFGIAKETGQISWVAEVHVMFLCVSQCVCVCVWDGCYAEHPSMLCT